MKRLVLATLLLATPALAQQPPPDPAFMQKVIAALQQQRNSAADAQAALSARIEMLTEENAALRKQVEDLKKPPDPPAK